MKYLATLSTFKTVTGWEDGPKKPTITSSAGNASEAQSLAGQISSLISNLGDGESVTYTVQAMNERSTS